LNYIHQSIAVSNQKVNCNRFAGKNKASVFLGNDPVGSGSTDGPCGGPIRLEHICNPSAGLRRQGNMPNRH
jgi:hypothetical protein